MFFLCFACFILIFCDGRLDQIPQIVPLPSKYQSKTDINDVYLILNYQSFQFQQSKPSTLLTSLIERYKGILFYDQKIPTLKTCPSGFKCLSKMDIVVEDQTYLLDPENGSTPFYGMNEGYSLSVDENEVISLHCEQIFGCYRGMETFSQMMILDDTNERYYVENYMPIVDTPRFGWRGLMIDTARHYLPIEKIKQIIDYISWLKLNTLHWHIIDAQSFPLEVKAFPLLNQKGSYSYPDAIYTHDTLTEIRDYASERGIRIVMEIDVPGHSGSWRLGYPEVMSNCEETNVNNYVLNPIVSETYTIINSILSELSEIFTDPFLHLGGDEIYLGCWEQDQNITKFKEDHGWATYDPFVGLFETELEKIYSRLGKTMVCWEECLLNDNVTLEHFTLPSKSIVQVWKTGSQFDHLHEVISKKKYSALMSGGWYLNQLSKWSVYYDNEPFSKYTYSDEEKKRLLGGEACVWGEHVDAANIDSVVFPALLAVAEKLWTPEEMTKDSDVAMPRHEAFRCQLYRRGLIAGPICPSYCKEADSNII